jgi:hypothetical protein
MDLRSSSLEIEAVRGEVNRARPLRAGEMRYQYALSLDHTDGNAWLHDVATTLAARENTLKRLSGGQRVIALTLGRPARGAAANGSRRHRFDKTNEQYIKEISHGD